jgi:N,N'-diacetylbacillosaminyl-diphospho-undecaprenol alpha-1,3-N-acetylgalactosaminyltransferase
MQKRVKKIVFLSHFDANLFLFRLPIMHALVNEGWEVIALCPEGDYHHRFVEFGVTHVSYDIDRGSLNPLREIVSIFSITRVLKDLRPDILHTFTVKPNIYGLLAGRAAKIDQMYASVTGLGSFFIERDLKSKIVKKLTLFLYKIVFRYATVVTFQNHDDQNLFIKHNLINKERTRLIKGSGIDTHLWQSHHKKSDGTVHFLFVGRLLKHKGVGEFIQAATTLKKTL